MRNDELAKTAPAILLATLLLLTLSAAQVWAPPAPDITVSYSASTYTITVSISNMSKGKNYYLEYYSPAGLRATHGPFYAPGTGTWNTTDTLTLQPTDRGGTWSVELYEETTLKRRENVDVKDTVWTTDSTFTSARASFAQGETVYVKGIGYNPNHGGGAEKGKYYMRFYYGASVKHTSPWITASSTWDITYSYTLPPDAPIGTWTVRVYCAEHGFQHGSTSFTVTAVYTGVQVSISPSYRSGPPGSTLSYAVTVVNSGNVGDTYTLNASDDAGWTLTLSQGSLTLPAGGSGMISLTVALPTDALGCTEDNIVIRAIGTGVENSATCVAHASVVRGVDVSISPSSQAAPPGSALSYEVAIANLGNVPDTFSLSTSDTLGWPLSLSQPSISLPAFGSGSVSLSVNMPLGTPAGTVDEITVAATGVSASDLASCTAIASTVRGVSISIFPLSQSVTPGAILSYAVTVSNLGNAPDTFSLTTSDVLSWPIALSQSSISLPAFDSGNVTLEVMVPTGTLAGTIDVITVTATGVGAEDSATCQASASAMRGVGISVSPSYQSALPGSVVGYTVMVTNLGNIEDTFSLAASDDAGWSLGISPASLTLPAGASDVAILSVAVPADAHGCLHDNITVVATSLGDPSASSSAACVAHAAVVRGVSVEISPSSKSGAPGETLDFTVRVRNEGNVPDSYSLSVSDNAGWGPTVQPSSLAIDAGSEAEATLSVTIPGGAADKEEDLIGLVATSEADPSVSGSANCIAQASVAPPPPSPPTPPAPSVRRGVSVSISPSSATGSPGETLAFEVTVINLGSAEDTFSIGSNGGAGWRNSLGRAHMVLAAGEVGRTTLYVEVDPFAPAGTSAVIEVTARSTSDPSASDIAQAMATASALGSTNSHIISSAGGWTAPPMPASLVPLATSFVSSLAIVWLSLYLLLPLGARRRRKGQ